MKYIIALILANILFVNCFAENNPENSVAKNGSEIIKHASTLFESQQYNDSKAALEAAGHGDSQYVIGMYIRGKGEEIMVNGIAVPRQHAIYANHRPEHLANAKLHWDTERYRDCGSDIGQPVLILKRSVKRNEEITADYGPLYDYEAHGFTRFHVGVSAQVSRMRMHAAASPRRRWMRSPRRRWMPSLRRLWMWAFWLLGVGADVSLCVDACGVLARV